MTLDMFLLLAVVTLTVVAFSRAWVGGSVRGLLGAGALWGLTLGVKANALFFPAIPALVLVLGGWPAAWQGRRRILVATLAGAGASGALVMVAAWPYLWADPLGRFTEHLLYLGQRTDHILDRHTASVLGMILLTTPLSFLGLFAVGLGVALRRAFRRDHLCLLLLVWIAVTLGRYLLPRTVNFDGVRHFLELFPAMAAIAGMGVAALARPLVAGLARFAPQWPPRALRAALLVACVAPGAWASMRTHPFQIAYWNPLAGGAAGAYRDGINQAGDYWGLSYRTGLRWINRNAPRDAYLAVPVVEHAVRLVAPLRLRSDVFLLPVSTPYSPRIAPDRLAKTRELAASAPVYVMFVERREWLNELMLDCLRDLEPEVVWEVDGAPVLRIYRYRPPRPPATSRPVPEGARP